MSMSLQQIINKDTQDNIISEESANNLKLNRQCK